MNPLSLGGATDGGNSITGFGGMEGELLGMSGIMGGACASAGMGDGMVMGGSGISASTGELREDVMRARLCHGLLKEQRCRSFCQEVFSQRNNW